ncbi:flagellin [Burkholderiaceae bacterium]
MSVINTNVKALAAQASMANVEKKMQASMERLSTGLRINSAKDDAAGLAISNRMTSQIRGYAVAIRNSNDGISMTQTAEGALGQVTDMLQRMRELSVQAGNGAMSTADRKSLQLEVDQMKQEINNVATKTNHNNIKLLDGSAGKIDLQTGVNSGDKMSIGFESVQTKDIGSGRSASLTSVGTKFDALAIDADTPPVPGQSGPMYNGDLTINGVVVGASSATDDKVSSDVSDTGGLAKSASAIAKAAAINRVSEQSGVVATVGKTTAFGTAMDATNSGDAGAVIINGQATAEITLGDDLEINRLMITNAINNISKQTGVTAINTHDDKQGVVLVAEDGRNIEIDLGDFTAASDVGLSDAGTYIGTFDLKSKTGEAFTLSTETNGSIQNAGLAAGTYGSNKATMVSLPRANAALNTPPSDTTTGVLNGGTLVINGVGIDAAIGSDDSSSSTFALSSTKAASAIAIAAAINKKSEMTGVRAVADQNVVRGTGFAPGPVTDLNINGVDIAINLDENSNRDDVLVAINKYSGQTGVVASGWGDGVQLTAADGRNISIGSSDGTAEMLGLTGQTIGTDVTDATTVTFYANVHLESDKAFEIASGSEGNANFNLLGFTRGTFGGNDNGMKVADVDITTQGGASAAISAIDDALETVSAMQAKAGAYQNRLESVVSNLTESNQNMSASRSRILDTDYASETTSMAKSQIISQAATAMLAQANQSAQGVLSLLK